MTDDVIREALDDAIRKVLDDLNQNGRVAGSGYLLPPHLTESLIVNTIASRQTISRLLLTGGEPLTDEQVAAHEARRVAAWAAYNAALARFTSLSNLQRELLDLHSLSDSGECEGCDYGGWEGEPPFWPCRTVELIAERAGIELPEMMPWGEDPNA